MCNETTKTCTASATGIKPGFCVIEGSCYSYGDIKSDDSCKVCDPPTSKISWSTAISCIDAGPDTGSVEEDTGEPEDTGIEDTGEPEDTGSLEDSGDDATSDAATTNELPTASACGCRVPGESSTNSAAGALAGLGIAIVIASRRRR
jgi:hypothetical protein